MRRIPHCWRSPRRCRGLTADATAHAVKIPPVLWKDSARRASAAALTRRIPHCWRSPRRCRGLTADATAHAVKIPPVLWKDSHYALTRSRCHLCYEKIVIMCSRGQDTTYFIRWIKKVDFFGASKNLTHKCCIIFLKSTIFAVSLCGWRVGCWDTFGIAGNSIGINVANKYF